MVALTVGMATYKDYDGVYFTIQALRLYQDMTDTELVVVDNFGDDHTREFVEGWAKGRYILAKDAVGTAAAKNVVFQEARGDAVLCCDSHVHFFPGVIARLKEYYREHPGERDLLQGPLVYDDLTSLSTHFAPEWRGQMWGTWATDPRGQDPEGEPFDIPMQGMGAFSCWRTSWPGFNPQFRGFGGEEGYIHEKVRQRGGRTLCLPWMRWVHRFGRPAGAPYPLFIEDKLRNYVIGFTELGLDLTPVTEHFKESLPVETIDRIVAEVRSTGTAVMTPGFTPIDVFTDAALGSPASPSGSAGSAGSNQPPTAETGRIVQASAANPPPAGPAAGGQLTVSSMRDRNHHRAIVCFVEDNRTLIQQLLALRESWRYIETTDTDLVVMGPGEVLGQLPEDLVKIEQRPVVDDPVWKGYRFINSIACLNGAGAERLDQYTHLLRSDVDTFITPAWNAFYPETFIFGTGGYVNDDNTRQHIRQIAADYGLVHRGIENIHSTWYGRTDVIRRACAFSEMLTKHILTHYFADQEGAWPGWYRGVATMYAGEIAVNHCAPDAQRSELVDAWSTSDESTARYPHVHCWHTDAKFSKFWFADGKYGPEDFENLDIGIIRDYCMEMARRSSRVLAGAALS